MCVVSIKIDESSLRGVRPDLDTKAAIQSWAQHLINLHIQEMEKVNDVVMDLEEARALIHKTIHDVYAEI